MILTIIIIRRQDVSARHGGFEDLTIVNTIFMIIDNHIIILTMMIIMIT